MTTPSDLKYTESHEWVRLDGDVATIGITAFAQEQLGDVVFVDMPQVGAEVSQGDGVAEVESTKTVSDIYAPASGEIVAVNEGISGAEDTINKDPYGQGWLFQIRVADKGQLDGLMDASAYQAHVDGQH